MEQATLKRGKLSPILTYQGLRWAKSESPSPPPEVCRRQINVPPRGDAEIEIFLQASTVDWRKVLGQRLCNELFHCTILSSRVGIFIKIFSFILTSNGISNVA